jgi:hypothetical protein
LEGGKGSTPEDCDTGIVGDFKKSPGTLYKADNWILAGVTEGNTKNHDGVGLNESYRIKKVVPKIMWCKWRDGFNQPIESFSVATWNATKKWNETLERRLKRTMPDITEEKWISLSADLKIKAKEISEKRKRYLGKSFHAIGRRIFIDGIPTI